MSWDWPTVDSGIQTTNRSFCVITIRAYLGKEPYTLYYVKILANCCKLVNRPLTEFHFQCSPRSSGAGCSKIVH